MCSMIEAVRRMSAVLAEIEAAVGPGGLAQSADEAAGLFALRALRAQIEVLELQTLAALDASGIGSVCRRHHTTVHDGLTLTRAPDGAITSPDRAPDPSSPPGSAPPLERAPASRSGALVA